MFGLSGKLNFVVVRVLLQKPRLHLAVESLFASVELLGIFKLLQSCIVSKGYDVLLMTDPVDEFIMQNFMQYDKKYLKSANKGELEIEKDPDAEEKALAEATKKYQKLLDYIFDKLQDKLSSVRLTRRLTDSTCCLVGESNSISPQLERLLKAMHQTAPESKRILELNPNHPVVEKMLSLCENDANSEQLEQYTNILYGEALLTEGSPLPDPLAFVKSVSALMK